MKFKELFGSQFNLIKIRLKLKFVIIWVKMHKIAQLYLNVLGLENLIRMILMIFGYTISRILKKFYKKLS